MKKKDIILIASLLILAVIGLFAVKYFQREEGATVIISIDGREYGRYSLDSEETIEIRDELGYNVVHISGGYADVTSADCPDQICVDHAPIRFNNETIVCLPHKLVVEILGGEDSGVDAVIKY